MIGYITDPGCVTSQPFSRKTGSPTNQNNFAPSLHLYTKLQTRTRHAATQ